MTGYGRHLIPLGILITATLIAYYLGVTDYFTYQQLKEHHHQLRVFVSNHPFSAPLAFMGAYILIAALSLPVGLYLTLLAGFLFEQPYSTIYVVIGQALGGSIIFLAARTALREFLRRKVRPFLNKMEKGFHENATSYMLFLRLVPIFPFWLVNLAPAFFGISFFTFLWTTVVGVIPATFMFTQFGTGLGSILETEQDFSWRALLNTDVLIAIGALFFFIGLYLTVLWWTRRNKNLS